MASFITVDDAKTWLDIDLNDTTQDDLLDSLVEAATHEAIKVMGRDPTRRNRVELVDGYGGATLPLNHYPIHSVSSVIIDPQNGAAPLPSNLYTFDDHLICLFSGKFPRGKRNIQVTYIAGLPSIPADICLAVKFIVKAMWDARLTDMNASSESFQGVGSTGFWPTGPGSVPPQAEAKLMRYYNPVRL